jgi:hypothetical protein
MATGAAVAIGASTTMQLIGAKKEEKAQIQAAREAAHAKRLQAFELLERARYNQEVLKKQGRQFIAKQQAAFIKGGVDISEGTPLTAMEEANSRIMNQLLINEKEAQLKYEALMAGADIDTRLASDIREVGKYRKAGIFLQGVGSLANIYK